MGGVRLFRFVLGDVSLLVCSQVILLYYSLTEVRGTYMQDVKNYKENGTKILWASSPLPRPANKDYTYDVSFLDLDTG